MHGLNEHKKSINGSRILVLGIAHNKNVDDMRESPFVEIMERLQGAWRSRRIHVCARFPQDASL